MLAVRENPAWRGRLRVGVAHWWQADERQVLLSILDDTGLAALLPGQTLIGDKNYHSRDFEAALSQAGLHLLRAARQGEPARPGAQFFRPLRQTIESVNDTLKGQLDLERRGGAHPSRGDHPGAAAHSRPDRRHLTQRPHRPA